MDRKLYVEHFSNACSRPADSVCWSWAMMTMSVSNCVSAEVELISMHIPCGMGLRSSYSASSMSRVCPSASQLNETHCNRLKYYYILYIIIYYYTLYITYYILVTLSTIDTAKVEILVWKYIWKIQRFAGDH